MNNVDFINKMSKNQLKIYYAKNLSGPVKIWFILNFSKYFAIFKKYSKYFEILNLKNIRNISNIF